MAPRKEPLPANGIASASKATTSGHAVEGSEPLIPAKLKLEKSASAQIANGFALLCICSMAFAIRLFSVIKYESVIHEFDPYFNYRVTQFLTKNGFYNMWNWFDDRTWYPLGRVVGGTVYPVRLCLSSVPAPFVSHECMLREPMLLAISLFSSDITARQSSCLSGSTCRFQS